MKTLVILSILQIGVLLLLFTRLVAIENRTSASVPVQYDIASKNDRNVDSPDDSGVVHLDGSSEALLRTIVREELAAQLSALKVADSQFATATAIQADEIDPSEYQYRVAAVSQQLDIYESVGNISENDMHRLQSEIMALNEADREEALSRLVKALNSGALKGRL